MAEVTPAAIDDFPRRVDDFAKSLRKRSAFGVKGGAMAVAALVSERVHPTAVQALTNRALSYGSIVVPAVVDLGTRQLHIAANTPVLGLVMWNNVRSQARNLPPRTPSGPGVSDERDMAAVASR